MFSDMEVLQPSPERRGKLRIFAIMIALSVSITPHRLLHFVFFFLFFLLVWY